MHRVVKVYARLIVGALDLHLLVQPSRGCVGSAEPPCRLLGAGRFECQVQFLSGNLFERVLLHNMSKRIKDDVESRAAEARRLVTDEEGEAQRSMRHFAWQLVLLGKVFDAVPGCQEPGLNPFLEMPWGYMHVFRLDMILEQGHGDVQRL